MDELKTQLNKYFVYLGENHITSYVFVQVPCVDLGADKDEDMWKTVYYHQVIHDDSDENNRLYLCVHSNCSHLDCQ